MFEKLNDNIKNVAVAVNPDVTMVKQVMDAGFDILQVHGNLTEEVLAVTEIPVWRAVNLTDANIFEELVREYRDLSIDEKSRHFSWMPKSLEAENLWMGCI